MLYYISVLNFAEYICTLHFGYISLMLKEITVGISVNGF